MEEYLINTCHSTPYNTLKQIMMEAEVQENINATAMVEGIEWLTKGGGVVS